MYNGNVDLVYSEARDSWNVIVDGEWYFEGTYEQAEKCAETFWFGDDEEDTDVDWFDGVDESMYEDEDYDFDEYDVSAEDYHE